MDLGIGGLGDGEEIGVGASAAVFRARQVDLDREVAVKILTATDDAFIRRFNREAKTLGKLSEHRGIVTVYDTGVNASGQPYLILELCKESLEHMLEQSGPFEPLIACGHLARVTGAVAAAHEAGVVHRDIKPANILVSADGRAMITDFGIATNAGVGDTNSVGFTAAYVAPETVNGRVAGPPGDVYSLGATLFHLVSGQTPFSVPGPSDQNIVAIAQAIANDPVPDLRPSGVPTEVCAVIEWAMAKDPDARPTAAQLADALELVAAGGRAETGHGRPAGSPPQADGAVAGETAEVMLVATSDDDAAGGSAATTMVTPGAIAGGGAGISPPRLPAKPPSAGPPGRGVLEFGAPESSRSPDGQSGDGLVPAAGGIPLPATAEAGQPGPMIDRRDRFVAPDDRLRTWLLTGAAVLLAFVVVGAGALWLLSREDETGDSVAAVEDQQRPGPQSDEPGNAQSGSFDPAGPPELRPNLGNAVTRVATPDVAGLTELRAEQSILSAGLRVNTVYRENQAVPVGQVISQDPAAGSRVQEDSLVTIFVSRRTSAPPIPVPEVAGLTVAAATEVLEGAGLSIDAQRSIYHDSVPGGVVVGTDPPVETLINASGSIVLFASLGQPTVPDLVGLTEEAAVAALSAVTLTAEVVMGPGAGEIGTVAGSTPEAGTAVAIDSVVQIVVIDTVVETCSLDPAAVVGKTVAEAEALAATANCTVGPQPPREFSATVPEDNVIRATIDGETVRFVVSKGVQPDPCDATQLASLVAGLVGLSRAVAVDQITAANCTVGSDLPPEISQTVNPGLVIRGEVTDTTVRLVLSAETCTVPSVVGLSMDAAKTAITTAGCTGPVSDGGAAGDAVVGGVTPAAESVIVVNAAITLIAEVTTEVVPDVVGMARAAAETALTDRGFVVVVTTTQLPAGSANIGKVTAQNPAGGVSAEVGTTVTITVGEEEPADSDDP
ncbi:MAG: PASTA domain-containing protein [Actinomycetota bacterium]